MTLRTRLMLSYSLIVVICLSIAAGSVTVLLQGYKDQVSLTRLGDMARPISVQIRSLLRGQTSLAEIWANAQEQAQNNNVYILFVDNKGDLLRAIYPDENNSQTFIVPKGLPHGISATTQGMFKTSGGEKFIYSAYPLGKSNPLLSLKADTLVLCQKQTKTGVILAGLLRPFIWAGIIALLVSILLAFLVARSVYYPVQRLSRAAENIAQGKYDEEVPVSGPEEIRGLALAFNQMAGKIKNSQQQLRHFVADVSHQLKSPLTSIQGFAQAMIDGTASDVETKNKAAGIIVDESKRMIRQVNELLELSRMQAGVVKMDRENVNIQDILNQCLDIFSLRVEEKKICIKNSFGYSGVVMGDADRLEDVFCNLLDNAIKNTLSQGVIQVITQKSKGDNLEVIIADSGPGIPPEQIPYVFDRFQASSGLRTGFGLGLAIAREIVLAHGGKIEVTSSPGEGAKFSVTLPHISSESTS
jgi:two-component system, OmpR family, sensor kinase